MNDFNKNKPIEPQISCDGWYAYCPICGHYDLLPEHEKCPRCEQSLDWSWIMEFREQA